MSGYIAIIDCGTNTFHLLIAEVINNEIKFHIKDRAVVKLGLEGFKDGRIAKEGLDRAITALNAFNEICKLYPIESTYAFATSALRSAKNGIEIRDELKRVTGIEVNIISGDQEAEFIFHGVTNAISVNNKPVLVVDIGGGSVEFIIGNNESIIWKHSYDIGAQRLLTQFHKSEPIKTNEINELQQYLKEILAELIDKLEEYQIDTLIGSSGTFDTLSEIYCLRKGLPFDREAPETPFDIEYFNDIHQDIISMSRAERLKIPGMIEMRVDMIVVASCLIDFLLKSKEFASIRVSTYALKEGALLDIYKGDFDS